jgi:hypothetical protein
MRRSNCRHSLFVVERRADNKQGRSSRSISFVVVVRPMVDMMDVVKIKDFCAILKATHTSLFELEVEDNKLERSEYSLSPHNFVGRSGLVLLMHDDNKSAIVCVGFSQRQDEHSSTK